MVENFSDLEGEVDEEARPDPFVIPRSIGIAMLGGVLFFLLWIAGAFIGNFVGRELFFVEIVVPGIAAYLAPAIAVIPFSKRINPHAVGVGFLFMLVAVGVAYSVLVVFAVQNAGISGGNKLVGVLSIISALTGGALAYRSLYRDH